MARQWQGNRPAGDVASAADELFFTVSGIERGTEDPREHPTVPAYGSLHPDPPLAARGLVVDFKDAEWLNGDTARVRVLYSNDGRFGSRWTPPAIAGYSDWAFTSTMAQRTVPRFRAAPRLTVDDLTGEPRRGTEWLEQPKGVDTSEFLLVREMNIESLGDPAIAAIAAQTGKIHSFWGTYWLFEAGSSVRVGLNVWKVRYSWTTRLTIPPQGSPSPFGFGHPQVDLDGDGVSDGGAASVLVPHIPLRPFHDYTLLPRDDDNNPGIIGNIDYSTAPIFGVERAGDFSDLNGYQTLPGGPIP